jgi:hypothetical protein
MPKYGSKVDVREIVQAHRDSYVSADTGMRRLRDYALLEGVPVAVGVTCWFVNPSFPDETYAVLLTVAGLLSALLFGVMLQISDRAVTWAADDPPRGPKTSAHADFLQELAANAGYASLVSIVAAIAYVIGVSSSGWILRLSTAAGMALGIHLLFVLMMVMKRVFSLTQSALTEARTEGAPPKIGDSSRKRSA